MTHRLRRRLGSRNSWSALLAVLLGALAGAAALGVSTSFAGGLSIAGHSADARTTGKTASVRPDAFDPSFKLGGLDDPGAVLAARDFDLETWASRLTSVLPVAFDLPNSAERVRDGRTRAPPRA